jgi:hypothetical protein
MDVITSAQELERLWFKASPGKMLDPISTNKLGMMLHICNFSYTGA